MKNKSEKIKETWEVQKAKLKEKFAGLTDTDFLFLEGKENEMIEKLKLKLGKTEVEIYQILNSI
ncbi:hypothetical protein AB3G33_13805 [Flavobacterium sp. WC2421]|uniref:General stress protein CsbD n=3 Tax=unclassified Flavobacterium TaxID=196869 RepID=A0AB39W6R5_9FLAO